MIMSAKFTDDLHMSGVSIQFGRKGLYSETATRFFQKSSGPEFKRAPGERCLFETSGLECAPMVRHFP